MDSEEDDDFFISATAVDDESYLPESVYIETKSPTKRHESLVIKSENTAKIEHESPKSLQRSYLKDDSSAESDLQIVDHPGLFDTVKASPKKRGAGRRRSDDHDNTSCDSDRSYVSEDDISPTLRTKRQKSSSAVANFLEPDENEDFFNEIAKETTARSSQINKSKPEQSKRVYNIRFLSKLDGTINKTVQVKVLGKYELSSILPTVLDRIFKQFDIPKMMHDLYRSENVTLYWNNAKLLKFMTCNSLRVPQAFENEVSDIDILMVSKESEEKFEEDRRLQLLQEEAAAAEEALLRKRKESLSTDSISSALNNDIEQFEKELKHSEEIKNGPSLSINNNEVECINLDSENDDDLMKIALVGQDNKKLYVNVRTSTRISKLVEYYRKRKFLPKSAKVKLLFDHDEIDQQQTVGEQDMEDEDMIEIVVY